MREKYDYCSRGPKVFCPGLYTLEPVLNLEMSKQNRTKGSTKLTRYVVCSPSFFVFVFLFCFVLF